MMDQIEFEDLIEKLKKRKEEGDIKNAIKVADRIPWDEVEDINLLMYVANIYEEGGQFKDAKLILEYAYEVAPVKNRLYYSLCLINAKCKELKDAISFYTDFCDAFPDDNRRLLLQYYIMNAKNASLNQQKRLLVEYLSEEKDEKMTFELALICDKLGEREETLEYCNFIINFYGVKKTGYGRNALLLKKKYATLTDAEETLLTEAEENYASTVNSDIEYKEPPIFYNDVRLENDKMNIPIEKVERIENQDEETKDVEADPQDELDEKSVPSSINIAYTPDEESYTEKEKNKMAFMHSNKVDKDKLRDLIDELKKEEENKNQAFYKFREKSFIRKGRLRDMKLSDTKLHMIIEAHSKDEGIEIAKGELNYIHSALDEKVPIAKASAYNMNEKGFKFYAEKISGKDLIIENAGMLKNELIDDIEEYIINKKGSTIFALVDIINNFDKIATERPSFIGRFDVYSVLSSRPQESLEITKEDILNHSTEREVPKVEKKAPKIEVEVPKVEKEEPKVEKEEIKTERELSTVNDEVKPTREESRAIKEEVSKIEERQAHAKKELTVDEFVDECKLYAKNIDCFMDGSTVTALYEKVEEMREDKIPLTVENAEALIEEAADRAEKPKLFSKPKYDKNGCLIITEDHFNF
ncbi:MAG: hypothetical protein IJ790_01770 [Lachnospiraceae bacterium]|nr:hypothetical protein [Lachnospiraceae bacterium]